MELSIVQLKSLTCEFLTRLTMNLESCQINVLYLMLFLDKGFGLMLDRS
jgi:hypothetical protein